MKEIVRPKRFGDEDVLWRNRPRATRRTTRVARQRDHPRRTRHRALPRRLRERRPRPHTLQGAPIRPRHAWTPPSPRPKHSHANSPQMRPQRPTRPRSTPSSTSSPTSSPPATLTKPRPCCASSSPTCASTAAAESCPPIASEYRRIDRYRRDYQATHRVTRGRGATRPDRSPSRVNSSESAAAQAAPARLRTGQPWTSRPDGCWMDAAAAEPSPPRSPSTSIA